MVYYLPERKSRIMAKLILTPENQLTRVNLITAEVKDWKLLDAEVLLFKPDPKRWSVLEVIGHMVSAYRDYEPRIDQLLAESPQRANGYEKFSARWLQRKLILSFRPKNDQRRYKMATMKKFYPDVSSTDASPEEIEGVFEQFFAYQNHLKQAILQSREKDVTKKQLVSAIGPIVRFYLPEAFDFLLSHEERHMHQAREVLAAAESTALH